MIFSHRIGTAMLALVLFPFCMGASPLFVPAPVVQQLQEAGTRPVDQGRRPIRVATALYEPFVILKDGRLTGFDVDLLDLVCRLRGLEYEIHVTSFQQALKEVQSGTSDMAIGCIYDLPERRRLFLFTRPYLESGLVLTVPTGSGLSNLEDLKGHRLGVKRNASGEQLAGELQKEGYNLSIVSYDSTLASFEALRRGEVEAVLNDYFNAFLLIQSRFSGDLQIAEGIFGKRLFSDSQAVWPVSKGRPDLQIELDAGLLQVKESPIFHDLFRKWFALSPPTNWSRILILGVIGLAALGILAWLFLRWRGLRIRNLALGDSERHFRSLVMDLPDAVFVLEKGRIVLVNKEGARLLGAGDQDLIGQSFASFFQTFSLDTPPMVAEALRLLTSEDGMATGAQVAGSGLGGDSRVEVEWIRRDGLHMPVRVRARTVFWAGTSAVELVVQDLTLSRAVEREQDSLREQLTQSQKMEAIGQLAGGIAHDFNNLLTGIVGCAELIRIQQGDRMVREQVSHILDSARRAADLTSKLLAFARKGKFHMQAVDLHELVEETVGLLRHTFHRKIQVKVALGDLPAVVKGDSAQLHQALLNLAINARDAMPEGGELTFESWREELDAVEARQRGVSGPGSYLCLAIRDTGHGIPAEILPHIFEPFFTTKPAGKGTGLGLSMVYGAAKGHGGTVDVMSEPGKGTTFSLLLPLSSEVRLFRDVLDEEEFAPVPSGKIVIVDDESVVALFLERVLQAAGFAAVAYTDSRQALEYVRDHRGQFVAVILDMVMPGMDGREIFHILKSEFPDLPVILSSGYALEGDAREVMEQGAVAFLQKPFHSKDLLAVLARLEGVESPALRPGTSVT